MVKKICNRINKESNKTKGCNNNEKNAASEQEIPPSTYHKTLSLIGMRINEIS